MQKRQGRSPNDDGGNTVFGRFLIEHGLTHESVAEELGVTRVMVSSMARGLKYPGADLMHAIDRWSDGEVPMQSWYEE